MRYSIAGATVQQAREAGATDTKEAPRVKLVFATLTGEQILKLKAQGCIVTKVSKTKAVIMPPVAPPRPVEGEPVYTPEQMVSAAGFEDLRGVTDPPLYGQGLNLAIIGTGIRASHEKIKGRVVHSKNFTSSPSGDGFDHDTGVASIIIAVAPQCGIIDLKVLNNDGEGTEEDAVMAIDYTIEQFEEGTEYASYVINLSLGAPDEGNPNSPLRVACRAAVEKGMWVMAAAGNEGPAPGTIMSPACEKYVAAVGSCKYEPFVVSEWSGRGPTVEGLVKPDMVAFGENIIVASSKGDTATAAKSGTSFSTPLTSGVSLLYHEGLLKFQGVSWPEGAPPGALLQFTEVLPLSMLLDDYLALLCIKPEGVPAGKDYNYGYGLPFGTLAARAMRLTAGLDISVVLSALVVVGMMGAMSKMMK